MSSQQEQRNVKESHTEEAEPNQAQVDETEQVPAAEQDVDQTAQTPEEGKSYADAAAEESLKVSKDEQDEVMQKLGADSTLEASAEGEELKVRPKELWITQATASERAMLSVQRPEAFSVSLTPEGLWSWDLHHSAFYGTTIFGGHRE